MFRLAADSTRYLYVVSARRLVRWTEWLVPSTAGFVAVYSEIDRTPYRTTWEPDAVVDQFTHASVMRAAEVGVP